MNRNIIIAVVAVVVIAGGSVATYFVMQNNDSNDSVSSEEKDTGKASVFSPASTLDKDFKATIETEGQDLEVSFEYDTDSKSVHYTTLTGDRTFESIITPDAYFSQINGSWVKYPVSQEQSGGFNPDDYQYKDEELRDYKSNVKYIGKRSCSEGKCNVWTADTPTSKSTFYVSTKDNYIIKVETVIDKKTTTINYDYQDVEVKAPADASELPDFRSSL
jgi:uncharacterized protein YxeA